MRWSKLHPVLAGTAATLVSMAGLAVVFGVAFSVYWDHAQNLREENSGTGMGFAVSDSQFEDLRLVFWILYLGMVVLVPMAAFAVGRMTRTPIPIVVSLVALAVVMVLFALPLLEFQNGCNVGDSFLFQVHC